MHPPLDELSLPKATLERLTTYLRQLTGLLARGEALVSSDRLAEVAGVHPAQVRKDLRYVHKSGIPGVGYEIKRLMDEISEALGLTTLKEAVLVGAGRLGTALAEYPGFSRYGLSIIALFDKDTAKIGQPVGGRAIKPLAELPDFIAQSGVRLGIICVPAEEAQPVTDLMVQSGILAIWCFAPAQISVPEEVFVKQEDLAAQLATLSYHLAQRSRAPEAEEKQAAPTQNASGRDAVDE